MLDLLGNLTIAVLCASTFGVYFGVGLDFALELAACLALAISIGISIPDFLACIGFAIGVTLGINAGVTINLPTANLDFEASFSAQLVLVLGLIAVLDAVIAVGGAEVEALTYSGPGNGLGAALGSATLASGDVEGLVLAATSSGAVPAGSVAGTVLLGGGSGWEEGLCSVSFAPPPLGVTATGTPTIAAGTFNGNATKVITGITVTNPGTGYDPKKPPAITISDSVPIAGATNASPIVLTIADTTDVTAITVADVTGPAAAGLMPLGKAKTWCAKVLTATTIALYEDTGFLVPSVASGVWASADGGTVTGNGAGAAAAVVMGGGSIAQIRGFFDGLVFGSGLEQAGSITLASILSVAFELFADLLGELEAEASALASAKLNFGVVPPSIGGNLKIVAGIDANLTAALRFIPPLPSIQANLHASVSGRAAFVASLLARIGLQLGFGTEALTVWTYSGNASGLGAALEGAIPSSSPAAAVILLARTPAASAALDVLFPAAA